MDAKHSGGARVTTIILLVVLVLQFELGMAVNLSPNLPSLHSFNLSVSSVINALSAAGQVAIVHASTGILLVILALINLILSWLSRQGGARVFGSLGFLAILSATYGGLGFTLSGFQNDGLSHAMATNFLLAFSFFFLELYMIKPAPKVNRG